MRVIITIKQEAMSKYTQAVFSDDRAAVELFLHDFGFEVISPIEDISAVQQTL